ncbi:MAG: ATP-binding protein [Bacteroidales bacterium]|jgi:predicted AAA+ superfamily ATPase|nr:ATP-binding protein [Bacteroidales bacterium]
METELIIREKYLNKVKPFIQKPIIKVFTGQRRVGKSYIMRQTIQQIEKKDKRGKIIYINKENVEFNSIATSTDLLEYISQHSTKSIRNYIFIDEIQEIKDFEKGMRSLLLNPAYDLYCTGSNANMLSGELSTLLSGRYIEIPVYSLSYPEFLIFHGLKNQEASMKKYLKYGGMPFLKHLELKDEIVYDYLKGILSSVMFRDVILRNKIRNSAFLENLIKFLADNTGQLFSARKISEYLKSQRIQITTAQIIKYIHYLTSSFLINKVQRQDIVGKKIFEIGEKYYFEDVGIRNTISNYKQTDIGKIIENVVYKHLKYNNFEVRVGQTGPYEIDFVAEKQGEKLYIQTCYLLHDQATIDREFGNLERIKDNYPKMVISMDQFTGNTFNGIQHLQLRDFLSMEL